MRETSSDSLQGDAGKSGFTFKSIALGSVMSALIGIVGPYWGVYLMSSTLFLDYSVGGVMFLLLVLVLVFNGLTRAVGLPGALRPAELVVVTAMMMVAGAITTMGLMGYLIPSMTAPYYMADDLNKWKEKLWDYLPAWAAPLDEDGGIVAIQQFNIGLAEGESIPWGRWVRPMAFWSIFVMALYACMISVMTIIRKQWVDYERLTFPVAQVPQELCAASAEPWSPSSIFRSKLFWFGFAVPSVACTLTALKKFYPGVPSGKLSITINDFGSVPFYVYLSYAVLGFTFLIPNRVAFSVWFLNIVSFIFRSIMAKYALEPPANLGIYGAKAPSMAFQGMGAMVVFTLAGLYFAREHLRKVLLCVIGRGEGYDRDEPTSYRFSVIVLALSLIVMVVWLTYAGMRVPYASALVVAAILIFFGLVRVVAQCGLSVTIAPMIAPVFVSQAFGSGNLYGTEVGALAQSWAWNSDIRTSVMSSAGHGMYLMRRRGRGLFGPLMLAALIAFVTAGAWTIWLGYQHGAANLAGWFFKEGPVYQFNWAVGDLTRARAPSAAAYTWGAVGAAITAGLLVANRLLFWWPIHPVGFLICSVYWTDTLVATIFLGWAAKVIVTRIGSNRALRSARRFFLGMILGQFSIAAIWAIFDTITGTLTHSIFWI